MTIEEQIVRTAASELGNYETPKGSNCQKYGAEFGFNCVAWCAIFVSIICKRVGIKWKFASTVAAMQSAQKNDIWSTTPRVGWACMRRYTANTGHVGVVEFIHSNGEITSLEGNTNAAGSREGDGTYRKRRPGSFWHGYINIPSLVENPPASQPIPPATPDDFKEKVMALPTLTEGAGVGERTNQAHYVRNLQALLVVAARDLVPDADRFIDGQLGSGTVSVLRTWQGRTGVLTPDGICGPATWAWLVGV